MVNHPTRTRKEIENAIGRTAEFGWTHGEPRTTPNGRSLAGYRDDSYCGFTLGGSDDGELAKFLSKVIFELKPATDALRELRKTGGSNSLIVIWYPNGDTGTDLSVPLLAEMSDMGIGLGINVYEDLSSKD